MFLSAFSDDFAMEAERNTKNVHVKKQCKNLVNIDYFRFVRVKVLLKFVFPCRFFARRNPASFRTSFWSTFGSLLEHF